MMWPSPPSAAIAEIDLVVTDMQMHGATDGASLARHIRGAFPASRAMHGRRRQPTPQSFESPTVLTP
jgi:CheY-like chemotaxis protein